MIHASVVENTYHAIRTKMAYLRENKTLGFEEPWFEDAWLSRAIDAESRYGIAAIDQPIPVWRVFHKGKEYRASKPISVRVYREGEFFLAENERLVVCGTGASRQEAFEDFCSHLVHFSRYYEALNERKARGDALRLKALFEHLLVEE
jgi:hypothetical protein